MSQPPNVTPFPGSQQKGQHLEAQAAEISVLGGVLLDNTCRDTIASIVSPDDFHKLNHGVIFKEMNTMGEANEPIDPVTLATHLQQVGKLDEIGGVEYLLYLASAVVTTVNIEHHAKLVQEAAEVRRLIQTCQSLITRATRGQYEDTTQLFDEAQQAVYELSNRRQGRGFMAMPEALEEVLRRVQSAYDAKSTVTGTPTGYIDLDEKTAGFQKGDLIILAARPSMGKTALALNLATSAAELSGGTVAIFSLEMPTAQLVTRMVSSEARVEGEKMRTGHLADGDIDRILQAMKKMRDWSILIDDTPGISVMEARSKCRRIATDHKYPPLSLIIIDYLQLMKGSSATRSREQEISEISRNLKGLAKELGVPVMALSQLNRSLESRPNKRPIMSDLRECVVGDTRVRLVNGDDLPIEALVGQRPEVWSIDAEGGPVKARASCVWSVGRKPVMQLRLMGGAALTATGGHRLKTEQGWRKLSSLRPGMRVASLSEGE
ncbi:replicative DNA helicase, partial [Myxococcota bacterium]|nr:replicative DNA helicase [Myxococcota bacterium]